MKSESRRIFLSRGVQAAGALAVAASARLAIGDDPAEADPLIDKAIAFLKERQGPDGNWSADRKEPGITALILAGLLRSKKVLPTEPVITRGLSYLEPLIAPRSGSVEVAHANYALSVGLMAFHEANQGGRYDALIKQARDYMKDKQWDEGEGKNRDDPFYGGAGYAGTANSRPDLSNTSFLLEALHDTGIPPSDPAFQKAVVFISRCQNLKSEFNDQPWADKINDGGFIYTAANGGTSVAGKDEATGGLRSYASMTYAGLRSLIYAGLTAEDPRVKAARDFLSKNYSVDENPGLGDVGLYYYYQAMAKTLAALGSDRFVDDKGTAHDWRSDIVGALARRQNPNGSWVNKNDRFMEGDANLSTAYGLLALGYVRSGKKSGA
ncbi:MAG: prenyltransferase/squalene oxidase repeat-containing protein [Isosphaeraceae bacterium]